MGKFKTARTKLFTSEDGQKLHWAKIKLTVYSILFRTIWHSFAQISTHAYQRLLDTSTVHEALMSPFVLPNR